MYTLTLIEPVSRSGGLKNSLYVPFTGSVSTLEVNSPDRANTVVAVRAKQLHRHRLVVACCSTW